MYPPSSGILRKLVKYTFRNNDGYARDVIDTTQTGAQFLDNMKPVANSSVEPSDVQTWDNVLFVGNGFDAWGLSLANNTLPYLDDPVAMLGHLETVIPRH